MAIKGPGMAAGLFGAADGKGSKTQHVPLGGKNTLTPGDTMSRAMGQYGKGHSYLDGAMTPGGPTPVTGAAGPPQAHEGVLGVRGGAGGMSKHPRSGGLGGNKEKMPGPFGD